MNMDCTASAPVRPQRTERARPGRCRGPGVRAASTHWIARAIPVVLGLVLMSATALSLIACGGNDEGVSAASPAATATETPTAAATFAIVPLFDDAGHPSSAAKSAEPTDPAMRTRAGLYASPDQYRWEALMNSPFTILIDLDTSGSMQAAIDAAMAARDWIFPDPRQLAWFVKSSDPRAGVQLADALTGRGLDQVFLIVGTTNGAR